MEELLQGFRALKAAEDNQRNIKTSGHDRQRFHMKFSSSSSFDSASLSPFLDAPSKNLLELPEDEAREIIAKLRESINFDERRLKEENPVDNKNQMAYLQKFLMEVKQAAGDDDTGQGAGDDADTHADRKDEARLGRIEHDRPIWVTFTLKVLFHIMVLANFIISWMDSSNLILEDAKMRKWLLVQDFNCLDVVPSLDAFDHCVNILHALLSCSVLYVQKRNSANLCLAWIASQGIHTVFKSFQYFFNVKFEDTAFEDTKGAKNLLVTVVFNLVGSLVILHKYYDITDSFGDNNKKFKTEKKTKERSLNDAVIYRNETSFLQRKSIMRDVTMSQLALIIKKITKHAKMGLRMDPMLLEREINAARLALDDCATADIRAIPFVLERQYKKWLKAMEKQQQEEAAKAKLKAPDTGYRPNPDDEEEEDEVYFKS